MELVLPLIVLRCFITSRERDIGVEGTSLFGYRVVLLVYVCIVLSSSVQKCSSILILSRCLQCKQGLDIMLYVSMCGEIVGEVNVFKLNDFELCTDKLPISILY